MTASPRPPIISAAWRIAVVVLTLGLALAATAALPMARGVSDPSTLTTRIAAGAVLSVLTLAVVALLLRRADGTGLGGAGLTHVRSGWRLALWGALVWTVPAAVTFAVLALLGSPLTVTAPAAEVAQTVLLLLLAVLLTEALPEEVVFRGYIMSVLGSVTRGWWVIAIQAVLFTLIAAVLRQSWNPTDLSLFLSMGIGLGYLRTVTGSVWMPIGFHAAFQTGAQLVLTHDAVVLDGGTGAAMLALGVVPFAVGAVVVSTAGTPRFAQAPASG